MAEVAIISCGFLRNEKCPEIWYGPLGPVMPGPEALQRHSDVCLRVGDQACACTSQSQSSKTILLGEVGLFLIIDRVLDMSRGTLGVRQAFCSALLHRLIVASTGYGSESLFRDSISRSGASTIRTLLFPFSRKCQSRSLGSLI
jgi:hypothetical protein